MTAANKSQFDQARVLHHNLRDVDRDAALFRCFTCSCWFDGAQQLDRNFHSLGVEILICPIAQAMMFDA